MWQSASMTRIVILALVSLAMADGWPTVGEHEFEDGVGTTYDAVQRPAQEFTVEIEDPSGFAPEDVLING